MRVNANFMNLRDIVNRLEMMASINFNLLLQTIFFFKQETAYEMRISDWRSYVCSSDLDDWSITASSFGREMTSGGDHGSGYGLRGTFAPINQDGNILDRKSGV